MESSMGDIIAFFETCDIHNMYYNMKVYKRAWGNLVDATRTFVLPGEEESFTEAEKEAKKQLNFAESDILNLSKTQGLPKPYKRVDDDIEFPMNEMHDEIFRLGYIPDTPGRLKVMTLYANTWKKIMIIVDGIVGDGLIG